MLGRLTLTPVVTGVWFSRCSLVFTNVPGPDQTAYFAGAPMLDVHIMVANVVPQVSVISYNGEPARVVRSLVRSAPC